MPLSTTPAEFDLAIVGGGLVGASLALSLAPLGLRIALVEAVPPVQGEQHPSFDERTTALANGTVRAFKTLGVWAGMEREAAPIRKIHVSDRGRFGSARVDAADQGLEALGYVVPNRVIGAALWQGLSRAPSVEVIAPARVTASELADASRVEGRARRAGPWASPRRAAAGRRRAPRALPSAPPRGRSRRRSSLPRWCRPGGSGSRGAPHTTGHRRRPRR